MNWLGASYALAKGVLLMVGGRFGDRYASGACFLIGIAGFHALLPYDGPASAVRIASPPARCSAGVLRRRQVRATKSMVTAAITKTTQAGRLPRYPQAVGDHVD